MVLTRQVHLQRNKLPDYSDYLRQGRTFTLITKNRMSELFIYGSEVAQKNRGQTMFYSLNGKCGLPPICLAPYLSQPHITDQPSNTLRVKNIP